MSSDDEEVYLPRTQKMDWDRILTRSRLSTKVFHPIITETDHPSLIMNPSEPHPVLDVSPALLPTIDLGPTYSEVRTDPNPLPELEFDVAVGRSKRVILWYG